MKRVGVFFCGGCNPHYDRVALAKAIAKQLDIKYQLVYNTLDCEHLLYLSGCTSSCAYKYHPNNLPSTIVAGLNINAQSVTSDKLLLSIVNHINKSIDTVNSHNS